MPSILETYTSTDKQELLENAVFPGAPHVKVSAKRVAPEGLQLTFNQDFDEIESEVATITVADDHEKGAWNINDRQTMPRYQKYGFFPALVNACEIFVREMAEKRKEDQRIEVDVSQPRVLSAFERQGYVLNRGHEKNAEMVRHPEQYPNEVVTEFPYTPPSRSGEQVINTMRDPQVFLKSVWDGKMQGREKPTIYDSLRVSLTKTISPTRTVIGKLAENTAGKIAGISPSFLNPEANAEPVDQSFAASLRPTNFDVGNVNIWQLENDPSVLVRESKIGEGETLDTLEASTYEAETLFAEMRAKYGIRVISMSSRREKNKEGKETIFTLVDKIEGKNLSKIESLPVEAKDELEALYLSLGQHYYDAWKSKYEAGGIKSSKKFWGDCRSDQFVYGNKYGEKDKHFYAVDVDPQFYREGDDKFRTIEAALGSLCGELVENERKFSPPIRLQAARAKLLGIINEILAKEPELKMIIEAKSWLQSA